MNLKRPFLSLHRSQRGFTMIEIALCLAVIGFALVAIIGVLPMGMNVQKENREQTIVNLDAAYLMDTLRSGARGPDLLTNYIISITNVSVFYNTNGVASTTVTNWYTTNQSYIGGSLQSYSVLTNGSNIVGLLSTPKYVMVTGAIPGYWSNLVTADFRAFSGPAVDMGNSQSSHEFAFTYRVTVEIAPSSDYPYYYPDTNWVNVSAPGIVTGGYPGPGAALNTAQHLQYNLNQLRLRFRWPILPNQQPSTGRQTYRSSASGTYTNISGVGGMSLWYLQPQNYGPALTP